jgi:hypothetical protein
LTWASASWAKASGHDFGLVYCSLQTLVKFNG